MGSQRVGHDQASEQQKAAIAAGLRPGPRRKPESSPHTNTQQIRREGRIRALCTKRRGQRRLEDSVNRGAVADGGRGQRTHPRTGQGNAELALAVIQPRVPPGQLLQPRRSHHLHQALPCCHLASLNLTAEPTECVLDTSCSLNNTKYMPLVWCHCSSGRQAGDNLASF